MWSCKFCIKKEQIISCCNKKECNNSSARFYKLEDFWDHLKNIHKKDYEKLMNGAK